MKTDAKTSARALGIIAAADQQGDFWVFKLGRWSLLVQRGAKR